MRDSVPLAYIRIWCAKNRLSVGFQTPDGDLYRINHQGIFLTLPDRSLSLVNPRVIFPVIDRYPSLTADQLLLPSTGRAALNAYSDDETVPAKRVGFEEINKEVESYLSLLTHLEPIQFYLAVRAYESGLVSLPHLNRLAGALGPETTLGTTLIKERMCTWEDLLSVCLDLHRVGAPGQPVSPAEYEMIGEIMIAIGRLTRTQLQKALNVKRGGDKPLGEILLQLGACTKADIESSLHAQERLKASLEERVGLLGELLVQQGIVAYDDLEGALRIQRMGRQALPAVLLSMGTCSGTQIADFKRRFPEHCRSGEVNEQAFIDYLLQNEMITPVQLDEARRMQENGRRVLGELLVDQQKCDPADIARLLGVQKEMRSTMKTQAPRRLGELLIKEQRVDSDTIETATKIQDMSRQKMGSTLVSLGTCTQEDFEDALNLQFNWRESSSNSNDRLGDQLIQSGLIDESNLKRALDVHSKGGKPLGQVLVETGSCSPESVIEVLIRRNERRRAELREFLQEKAPPPAGTTETSSNGEKPAKASLVERLSTWFKR